MSVHGTVSQRSPLPLPFLPLATAPPQLRPARGIRDAIPSGTGAAVNWRFALGVLILPARLPQSQPVPSGPIFTDQSPPFRGLPALRVTGTPKFSGVKSPRPPRTAMWVAQTRSCCHSAAEIPGPCTAEGGVWAEPREAGHSPTWHPSSCRAATLMASRSASPGTFQALNKCLLAAQVGV